MGCAAGTKGLPADAKLLGVAPEEAELREAASSAFRVCARQARTDAERYELVDRANQVRPVTWT